MILRSALRSYASELVGAGTEYKVVPSNTEAGGSATSAGQESVLKTGTPPVSGEPCQAAPVATPQRCTRRPAAAPSRAPWGAGQLGQFPVPLAAERPP